MNDGIHSSTKIIKRVEPLIGVPQLKAQYLHGMESRDNNGVELSPETLQSYIELAISLLEHDLDICILEKEIVEEKDYFGNDYQDWGYMQLNNIPVARMNPVDPIAVSYLRNQDGSAQNIMLIPPSWIRLREHDGVIRLVPNNSIPTQLMVGAGGYFTPELFSRQSHIPALWTVKYTAGFADGKVPTIINAAIGLIAAICALNNSADLIVGAGVASYSLSLDGLSQSVSTTSSAENHSNSAKVKEYQKMLFGESINSPNRGLVRTLRDYYQGQSMQIL